MRALLLIFSMAVFISPVSAIPINIIGAGAPKVNVYRPCETQVVVYDARPEMGVSFEHEKPAIGALDAIGVRIARVVLEMDTMEPTDKPGVYDSTYLDKWDKLVDECRTRGVCLVVAIRGNMAKIEVSTTMIERLSRFTADMATRYPSVAYWEVGQNMNGCLSMVRNDLTAAEEGKLCAQLLKTLYPALKSANPAAQVICSAWFDEFLKGVYEGGGRRLFDIALVRTNSKDFATTALETGNIILSQGDETKPLWCLYADGFAQNKLEEAFQVNNAANSYQQFQRVLVEKTGPVEEARWLPDAQVNSAITSKPRNTTDIFIPTQKPMIPLGYDYKEGSVDDKSGIWIRRVVVDGLAPTVIQLRYTAEPKAVSSGNKPEPKKESDKQLADPWDI